MNESYRMIRDAWHAHIATGAVEAGQAADEIAASLRVDTGFCATFLDDTLRRTVYEEGIGLLSAARGAVTMRVATAGEVAEVMASGVTGAGGAWARWLERDPTTGTHVRIVDMTRDQLLAAANDRDARAKVQRTRARFNRALAAQMGDGQRVRDAWTDYAIDALWRRVSGEEQGDGAHG